MRCLRFKLALYAFRKQSDMNTLVFEVCDEISPYWAELERLFQSNWTEFSFVDTYKAKSELPPVIFAVRNWWFSLLSMSRATW